MDSEERIVRLAKPIKKGLLRLVFSRFFVIALLLVVQVAIAVVAYIRFSDKIHILLYIQWAFVFVMIVFLFNSSMDADHSPASAGRGSHALVHPVQCRPPQRD